MILLKKLLLPSRRIRVIVELGKAGGGALAPLLSFEIFIFVLGKRKEEKESSNNGAKLWHDIISNRPVKKVLGLRFVSSL